MTSDSYYRTAIEDFQAAHQKATLEELLARLQGKSNALLSFEEVSKKLKLQARSERGVQDIPLDAIVGSVGRYSDFTRTFLPRKAGDQQRWAQVKASLEHSGFPPIDVYKVSDVYFVLDGNHRVSVARQEGWNTIQANVIEVKSSVPLKADTSPDELIIKSEYADFLEETRLHQHRPNVDLTVTIPGQYQKLLQHIQIHRYYAWVDRSLSWSFDEALLDWYDTIYIPFAETIRDRGLLHWFPDRTVTDFYLWVTEHRDALQKELGWRIRPEAVAETLLAKSAQAADAETGSWRKSKLMERYSESLFKDILIPLNHTDDSWQAVQQALFVAQREGSILQGLHVEDTQAHLEAEINVMRERFQKMCAEADVQGALALEIGEPAEKILARARLADLLVLKISYPPQTGIPSLGSSLRMILARVPRPILAVPGDALQPSHALLAFDGSARAKEALFLATYLSEQWGLALTVFSALENGSLSENIQKEARAYLDLHEINVNYVIAKGPLESARDLICERGIDLMVMGGYSGFTLKEFFIGSNVSLALKELKIPILICR